MKEQCLRRLQKSFGFLLEGIHKFVREKLLLEHHRDSMLEQFWFCMDYLKPYGNVVNQNETSLFQVASV